MRDHGPVDSQQALVTVQQFLLPDPSYQITNIVLGIPSHCIEVVRVLFSGFRRGFLYSFRISLAVAKRQGGVTYALHSHPSDA